MFPTVHVAGTNGKGSTATLIASALRAAGHSVGLYTSPHLVDLRERVFVDNQPISAEAFTEWTVRLQPVIEKTGASFFEAYTAIAFADFAARAVDVAVIETGLGGRLDATNVIDPLVSVVTSIGMDHTEYLGDSLREIAFEKGHVAKPGRPFVIGETSPQLVEDLGALAVGREAVPVIVDPALKYGGPLSLKGAHQARNAAVAQATLEQLADSWNVTGEDILCGFSGARIPGRYDVRGTFIFDIAHNRQAIDALLQTLQSEGIARPLHVLVAILRDKDYEPILADLSDFADYVWVTVAPSAPGARKLTLRDADIGCENVTLEPDFDVALQRTQVAARTVLVTGSAYTVGDAMARLPGLSPLG